MIHPVPSRSLQRLVIRLLVSLISLSPLHSVLAEERTILVLSGGGARGAAHIGVLQALEELKIPVHGVVGTSMGAVVGGLYAAGYSPTQLERILARVSWSDLFIETIPRSKTRFRDKQEDAALVRRAASGISLKDGIKLPKGAVQGHRIKQFLRRQLLHLDGPNPFDALAIPFRALATDLATGLPVELGDGDMVDALFASFAIPTLVEPILIDDHLLVDGGVSNNLPVDVARAMGATRIIAVDVSSPLKPVEALGSLVDITDQLTSILTRRNTEAQLARLGDNDVLIVPSLGNISSVDFDNALTAVAEGHASTVALAAALEPLAITADAFEDWQSTHRRTPVEQIQIASIRVDSDSRLNERKFLRNRPLEAGIVSVDDVEGVIESVYNTDFFSQVPYYLEDEQLVIQPIRKAWGPNFLQVGIELQDNFAGRSQYTLGLALTVTELNDAGGEWRTEVNVGDRPKLKSEYYQPLGNSGGWFVTPAIEAGGFNFGIYENNRELARYRVRQIVGGVDFGYTFQPNSEIKIGARNGGGQLKLLVGDPAFGSLDADQGYVFFKYAFDSLDNLYFPRSGQQFSAEWRTANESLGSVADYESWQIDFGRAMSFDDHTLFASLSAAKVSSGEAPLHEQFFLGGFLELSGLDVDQLSGQQRGLAKLVYSYRWVTSPIVPAYVGFSIESGNVWRENDDPGFSDLLTSGSIFVGIDSPLGPVYAAAGLAEGGEKSIYLLLGRPL